MSQSGAHQPATCQKEAKSLQNVRLPKPCRDDGVYPSVSMPKGILAIASLLIILFHPLYTRKKKNSGWLGGVQGARQMLQILIWSRFDGEHGRRRRRLAVSPFLLIFRGVYPSLPNALIFSLLLISLSQLRTLEPAFSHMRVLWLIVRPD